MRSGRPRRDVLRSMNRWREVTVMRAARIALLFTLALAPAAARAGDTPVSINCLDAVGVPGGIASVQVVLVRDGEAMVAGTQNNLEYNSGRFSIARGDCVINPAIGPGTEVDKELQQNVLDDPARVVAIVVSLNTVNVIPPGLLYTCSFRVNADTPLGTYDVLTTHPIASTANG